MPRLLIAWQTSVTLLQGARTAERLPREALLQLGVTLGTAVSDAPAQATALYASLGDARGGVTALAGAAARAAAGGYASTMRLQAMMGEVGAFADFNWRLEHNSLIVYVTGCGMQGGTAVADMCENLAQRLGVR